VLDGAASLDLTMYLLAPTVLRVAPRELRARAQARFGAELRRAGSFAQLCLLGAQDCLDAAPAAGPLGMLWTSTHGALLATRAALADGLSRGEPAMPFTFVATQPHLAAAFLAQRSHPIARSAFVYLAAEGWPWLARLAQAWLPDFGRILVGRVEESIADDVAHQSDWCLLAKEPGERLSIPFEGSDFLHALQGAMRPGKPAPTDGSFEADI
jgi:hypothetical protein